MLTSVDSWSCFRTLLGQLGRLQELICSFGGTRLKCTNGANTGLMTATGPGSGSISTVQPHGSRNTNGNNSTVLMVRVSLYFRFSFPRGFVFEVSFVIFRWLYFLVTGEQHVRKNNWVTGVFFS